MTEVGVQEPSLPCKSLAGGGSLQASQEDSGWQLRAEEERGECQRNPSTLSCPVKEDQGVKVGDYPMPGQLGRGKSQQDEEWKELGKKRHRRHPSKKKRKWKPYNKLTWEEKKRLEERESQRAARSLELSLYLQILRDPRQMLENRTIMSSSGIPPSHRQPPEEVEAEGLPEGDGQGEEMRGAGAHSILRDPRQTLENRTIMSSSGSPPSHRQPPEEVEAEGLPEGDGQGEEMRGAGAHSILRDPRQTLENRTIMSSSGIPPSHRQPPEEDEAEGLPEGDGQGGEMRGAGAHNSSQFGARRRVPQSTSHCRRNAIHGGHRRASQRAPEQAEEEEGIDVDTLIQAVQSREPLWNMSDRRHDDQFVTRRLWEEVCSAVLDNWEELDAGAQDLARNRVIVRWRSLRDCFKREFNKEMQAPSGSRGRRSRYKYARALSFLRSMLLSRR
ncbi:uncharacterized protein LOC143765705 [Ranitomeya variabilis]|uniref:uncharacterized protein LOC143765705 n=1 Tax=Ranitomeya variabilis TaxID=490064 RepID=UPI004056B67E